MEFMLDTLNLDEIKKWARVLPLAGVTSNPTIAKKEGNIDFFRLNLPIVLLPVLNQYSSSPFDYNREQGNLRLLQ